MMVCLKTFFFVWGAALFVSISANIHTQEDGFTFDMAEEMNVVNPPQPLVRTETKTHEAVVGKIFHFTLQRFAQPKRHRVSLFAKMENAKALPHWLIFSKKTASFWGVPLPGDEGTLHITVSTLKGPSESIELHVKGDDSATNTCKSNEDDTILSLVVDKSVQEIKPKQRVMALNNIAKFFKMPYTAFSLKPQLETDDITDASVMLAGPGNVQTKTSKSTSRFQVIVGCDGRLWDTVEPVIDNLKQQSRDGTIAEVLRLPLIGWRVKTETKPDLRKKRQAADDLGSGDYGDNDGDYYDEEDYDAYDDDLGDVESNPPASNKPVAIPAKTTTSSTSTTTSTTTTTTTTVPSSTHPHRHHHGELLPEGDDVFSLDTHNRPEESVTLPISSSTPTSTQRKLPKDPGPTKIDIPKPTDSSPFIDDYDYNYDDEDDTDEPAESETIIPDLPKVVTEGRAQVFTTESGVSKGEIIDDGDIETVTIPMRTTTTSEVPFKEIIVEDTESPTFTVVAPSVTTTEGKPAITTTSTESATLSTTLKSTTPDTTSTQASTTSTTTTTELTTILLETVPPTTTTTTTTTTTQSSTVAATSFIPLIITVDDNNDDDEDNVATTPRHVSSSTVYEEVTEYVEPVDRIHPKNTKPYIEKRLQYQSVTAGKVFRYVIPKNTFKDMEDGYNLTFQVLDEHEQPISKSSWLQFTPGRRELYGLPLAEDVSNWVYIIRATDKEGAYEQDQLIVQVQQHRLERVINHEFILYIRIEKPREYPHYVDWSLRVLRALGVIYNTNMSEITVRHVNYTSEPVVFAWSNDSLPTNYCPRNVIGDLFKILTANDLGDPSRELSSNLASDLRIKKVLHRELAVCEQPPVPPAVPVTPATNFSPILRNPVDKVNATLGELLIFKVKDDTFYDPEDVDPASLNITLLTADLTPIPADNWLQFDSKNREFYGIPHKTGGTVYFLVCVDTGGMSAQDSLEVVVLPATKRSYNVEFSMNIEVPIETFSNNAGLQRKFVEKLMEIFGEATPNNFHFLPYVAKREPNFDSTTVYWFNKTLPVEVCPNDEIKQLESMLHSDATSISSRVHRIMRPDFTVSTIKVHLLGNCKAKSQAPPTPESSVPSKETPRPQAENDIMITLILPIIIIAIMLFIAVVAACILYRKRRMGKMNMEEDGRQSYGNKGIPVIFQEELEEKPEPGTKAPVILKDEKPPLAPPEYSKSGSVKLEDSEPYQPPPPFTRTQENGRQPRPKPTPTYRKPPPYVPP